MMNWKVHLTKPAHKLGYEVIIYNELPNGAIETYNPSNDLIEKVDLGVATKPLYFPPGSLEAIFDELQAKGLKPKEQSFVEGKLEAQSEHLKDMRTLLKLDK